jgi:hypothetical protein
MFTSSFLICMIESFTQHPFGFLSYVYSIRIYVRRELMDKAQRDLIDIMVRNVLKKHKADITLNTLDKNEKEEIKNIIQNIQSEVEQFLNKKKS